MKKLLNDLITVMSIIYADEIHVITSDSKIYNDFTNEYEYTYKTHIYIYNKEIYDIFKDKVLTLLFNIVDYSKSCEFAIENTPNRFIINYPDEGENENDFELHYI